jgi:periodic tryptophan protein 1
MRFYFISSFGSFRVFGGTAVTTMISAVAWVPRGAAKPVPKQAEVDAAELEAMKQQLEAQEAEAGEDGDDGEEDEEDSEGDEGDSAGMSEDSDEEETGGAATAVAQAKAAAAALRNASGKKSKRDQSSTAADGLDQALAELDMDNYDNEDAAVPNLVSRAMGGKLEMLGDDPYLTLGDSDEDSEIEDLELKPDDLLILAARSEDDIHNLEVWVYEEPEQLGYEANVYVHHEVVLPAFPLCLAWLDLNPSLSNPASARGNLVAVGSMEPGIEIWDLDVVDAVEPAAVLGGEDTVAMKAALEEAKQAATKGGEEKLDKKKKKVGCNVHTGTWPVLGCGEHCMVCPFLLAALVANTNPTTSCPNAIKVALCTAFEHTAVACLPPI